MYDVVIFVWGKEKKELHKVRGSGRGRGCVLRVELG